MLSSNQFFDNHRGEHVKFLPLLAPIFFLTAEHWLTEVKMGEGDRYILEMEDGSMWHINSYDGEKILSWRPNDTLFIVQNTLWFSRHNYRIVHKNDGAAVEAKFFRKPASPGPYSRYIADIDHARKILLLNDNTRWDFSDSDPNIFKNWAPDDYLIIGATMMEDGGALLINVDINNAAYANPF